MRRQHQGVLPTDATTGPGHDRHAAVAEIKAAGSEAIANGADVADWAQAKAMIDEAVCTFGKLDVLINNAGILRDRTIVNITEAEWDSVIEVHLKGTFTPTHHATAYWRDLSKASGAPVNARIINTSSNSRHLRQHRSDEGYGAAKGRGSRPSPSSRRGVGPLWRHGQRHRAGGADPPDRSPGSPVTDERRKHRQHAVGVADRDLARQRGVRRCQRPRVRGGQRHFGDR